MSRYNRIINLILCFILLTAFMGCASTEKRQSTGEYVDDTVITTKVKTAIFNEPTLKSTQISVKTHNGVVQLSGFVDTPASVTRAGDVAERVQGVMAVKNDLIVK